MIHELKVLQKYFKEVISGKKTFEIRKNDRPFHVGDLLALNKYDAEHKWYTGNSCIVYIDYILSDEEYCKHGYVAMSIKPYFISKTKETNSLFSGLYKESIDYKVPLATREKHENQEKRGIKS